VRPYLKKKKNPSQKRAGGVAQGVGLSSNLRKKKYNWYSGRNSPVLRVQGEFILPVSQGPLRLSCWSVYWSRIFVAELLSLPGSACWGKGLYFLSPGASEEPGLSI
jgi:hypothetical protein